MVPAATGVRRRRLDPDPGRLLRAGRDEADPRPRVPSPAGQGWLGLTVVRRAGAHGRRQRAAARRDARAPPAGDADRRAAVRAAATPRRPPRRRAAADRRLTQAAARPDRHASRPTSARPGRRTAALLRRPRPRRRASAIPAYGLAGVEFLQTWLRGDLRGVARGSRPARMLEPLDPPDGCAPGVAWSTAPPAGTAAAAGEATTARITRAVGRVRRAADARPGHHGDRGRGRLRPLGAAGDRHRRRASRRSRRLFNLTGQPAVTSRRASAADGLPLSVQLVGRPGAEDMLYSLAGQIEAARPWEQHHPHV